MNKTKLLMLSTCLVASLSLTGCIYKFSPKDGDGDKDQETDPVVTPDIDDSETEVQTEDVTTVVSAQTYKNYSRNCIYEVDSAPTTGEINVMVIPVWFTDSDEYIINPENVRSDIEKAYFGTAEETGWNSVKSFYETESAGNLKINGIVTPWYDCGKASRAFYSSDEETSNLAKKAVNRFFEQYAETYTRQDFDADKDGYLDAVMLIYGAPDYTIINNGRRNESADNLWAYCYWLQDDTYKNVMSPGPNTYFWASYDFMYNDAKALERTGGFRYGSGNTSNCNIDAHTYIHEMGHVFGLDDYYDYSGQYQPAGGFSMQDYNVGGHDPFSTFASGWSTAYIPSTTCTIELKPFQSGHEFILLTPSWNRYNSAFDEYLILEYYTPDGLNALDVNHDYFGDGRVVGSKTSGIRLWHVDARLAVVDEVGPGDSITKYHVSQNARDTSGYGVYHMMSNTFYSKSEEKKDNGGTNKYISILGKELSEFNILQLIRKSTTKDYHDNSQFTAEDLFVTGDTFGMTSHYRQFVKGEKLNAGIPLGYEFKVMNMDAEKATIKIVRAI